MEKRKTASGFQRRRTLRLTAEEDERLTRQAVTAGISVSEYMRRLFFGGRPIIARTDDQTIRELRRLGGLLKHHFDVVKRTGNAATLAELDAALREVRRAIEPLCKSNIKAKTPKPPTSTKPTPPCIAAWGNKTLAHTPTTGKTNLLSPEAEIS